jgi:hypothetical protein
VTSTEACFVFDSTNAALWAEDVARDAGIPSDVVPAPAASDAKCDLALLTTADRAADLHAALDSAGVPHRRWIEPG